MTDQYRSYNLSGNLPPEAWSAATTVLNQLGLTLSRDKPVATPAPAAESESDEVIVLNRADFDTVSLDEFGLTIHATKAWNCVTGLYTEANNPEYPYRMLQNYDHVGLVFQTAPKPPTRKDMFEWRNYQKGIYDLELPSLTAFVDSVDVARRRLRADSLSRLIGRSHGERTFGLLRSIIERDDIGRLVPRTI